MWSEPEGSEPEGSEPELSKTSGSAPISGSTAGSTARDGRDSTTGFCKACVIQVVPALAPVKDLDTVTQASWRDYVTRHTKCMTLPMGA